MKLRKLVENWKNKQKENKEEETDASKYNIYMCTYVHIWSCNFKDVSHRPVDIQRGDYDD